MAFRSDDPENGGMDPSPITRTYRTKTQSWWNSKEFLEEDQEFVYKDTDKSWGSNDLWYISDSFMDMNSSNAISNCYRKPAKVHLKLPEDTDAWLEQDTNHGFIRVYPPTPGAISSELIPCTLTTTAQGICLEMGQNTNALHVQFNGDIIQRVDPYQYPLSIQNDFLRSIGYTDNSRIQREGCSRELSYLIKFYFGKPIDDSTYTRHYLTGVLLVRKGRVFKEWSERFCVLSGTRLLIFRDKTKNTKPTTVQLAKGKVEVAEIKGQSLVLKLTSKLQGDRSVYLAFKNASVHNKWFKRCKKATSKLPTAADLSNSHLECIPESIFVNMDLRILNLRHNVLRERPLEDDAYTIGWLDDLPRFQFLSSLNLADNDLRSFPNVVCEIRTLTELNLSSNKIEEISPEIKELKELQTLHMHNNRLASLPEELVQLEKLTVFVLAFNMFTNIPRVVATLLDPAVSKVTTVIMAGNLIEKLPKEVIYKLKFGRKIDLRLNRLSLLPTETAQFSALDQLTHLDIRDNQATELDLRNVPTLEYLNCERNEIISLQLHGAHLKFLHASRNNIKHISIVTKPEWLIHCDLSRNDTVFLPECLASCFFLQRLYISHNKLRALPERLFCEARSLRVLRADHNMLTQLPLAMEHQFLVEEILLHHNRISQLPAEFLKNATRLRILNLSKNKLVHLPPPNSNEDLNKLQEFYLSSNYLQDDIMRVIRRFKRLKILHVAYNQLYNIDDGDIECLELIQDLNISGNKLQIIPEAVARLPKLTTFRAHSNRLLALPMDFSGAPSLKVLDVASNKLLNFSVPNLMDSQLCLLDMSCNEQLSISHNDLQRLKYKKAVTLVDSTGKNRRLPGREVLQNGEAYIPWEVGLSESTGSRNKLCVAVIKKVKFHEDGALFAMFDGGLNNDVPKILQKKFVRILEKEMENKDHPEKYMKYAFLTAHKKLKSAGQRLGASAAVCHIKRIGKNGGATYQMNIANSGSIEAMLVRGREVLVLTRCFMVTKDREERLRICRNDGLITEDNKVSGSSVNTRVLGCSYLHPYVLPDPHRLNITLGRDDKYIVIANQQLWRHVSYQEVASEIIHQPNAVVAAKKILDLAQSYGCKENVSVLVVALDLFGCGVMGSCTDASDTDREGMEDNFGLLTLADLTDSMPDCGFDTMKKSYKHSPKLRPLPNRRFAKKNQAAEWENLLQQRLSEEVKVRELKSSFSEILDDEEKGLLVANSYKKRNRKLKRKPITEVESYPYGRKQTDTDSSSNSDTDTISAGSGQRGGLDHVISSSDEDVYQCVHGYQSDDEGLVNRADVHSGFSLKSRSSNSNGKESSSDTIKLPASNYTELNSWDSAENLDDAGYDAPPGTNSPSGSVSSIQISPVRNPNKIHYEEVGFVDSQPPIQNTDQIEYEDYHSEEQPRVFNPNKKHYEELEFPERPVGNYDEIDYDSDDNDRRKSDIYVEFNVEDDPVDYRGASGISRCEGDYEDLTFGDNPSNRRMSEGPYTELHFNHNQNSCANGYSNTESEESLYATVNKRGRGSNGNLFYTPGAEADNFGDETYATVKKKHPIPIQMEEQEVYINLSSESDGERPPERPKVHSDTTVNIVSFL